MRKKSTLLQLMFMLLFILLIVGFTPARNLLNTNAQNVAITPTYGCLAPGCTGSPSVSPSPTTTLNTSQIPTIALSPTPIVSIPAPTSTTQPCATSPLSSVTSLSHTVSQAPDQHRGGHHNGGFLKEFFKLFLLMLEVILKVGGGSGLPCSPTATTNTTTPTVAPTVPVASTAPAPSTVPASASGTTGTGTSSSVGASVVGTGPNSIFGGGPYGNTCTPGQLYCNGHVVTGGQANTLYTCEPHGIPTAKQTCPGACKVNASGNDSC